MAVCALDVSANGPACCSAAGALTTLPAAVSASETVPVGVPDSCSLNEVTEAVLKVLTDSVVSWPPRLSARKARLTCASCPPFTPA